MSQLSDQRCVANVRKHRQATGLMRNQVRAAIVGIALSPSVAIGLNGDLAQLLKQACAKHFVSLPFTERRILKRTKASTFATKNPPTAGFLSFFSVATLRQQRLGDQRVPRRPSARYPQRGSRT
jgi:hypothetical protein